MLTLSPKFIMRTFWEKALQPAFAAMSCILFPLGRINDPSSPVASANGMFYMISRHAYNKIGGHEAVKGLAVEDIGIGKRVKASGLGLLFANGKQVLKTRMYCGLGETVRGWTRILSASMNYQLTTVLKYLMVHILVGFPVLLLAFWIYASRASYLWPNSWFLLPMVCLLEMSIASPLYCMQLGVSKKYSVLLILGNLMLVWVFLVIAKKILFNEALQWRGTTYLSNRYQPTMLDPAPERADFASDRVRSVEL
jgi:chlorobactene glucosyltransferase